MDLININKSENNFISTNLWCPLPNRSVYGGQIVAQSLKAAYNSVDENFTVRSLHSFFLLPAQITERIEYKILNLRDGRNIKTREVKAYQNDKLVFTMLVNFSIKEEFVHIYHKKIELSDLNFISFADFVIKSYSFLENEQKEILNEHLEKFNSKINVDIAFNRKEYTILKFKLNEKIDSENNFSCYLSFISDFFILTSASFFIENGLFSKEVKKMASVDHAVNFFDNEVNINELFLVAKCVKISGEKIFCIAKLYNEKSELIAHITQEGIYRK
ncbi:hypothetical protein GVAV_002999 [Gurleya vavrai]